MRRHLLALPRCLALTALTAAGLLYGVQVGLAGLVVVPLAPVVRGQYRLAALGRRLARDWGGVDLPDPDRSPPPRPTPREDGWYAHDAALFRSARLPALMLELEHYTQDPATLREWQWLWLMPLTGGLPVAAAPALVAAGLVIGATAPWGVLVSVVVAVALAAAGFVLAPVAVRAHALASWWLLARDPRLRWRRSRAGSWLRRGSGAAWQGAGLAGLAQSAFAGQLLALAGGLISWGWLFAPLTVSARPRTEYYRRVAGQWTGADLPSPYRPFPRPPVPGADGRYRVGRSLYREVGDAVRAQRHSWVRTDPATWRDGLWALLSAATAPLSILPAVCVVLGFYCLALQPLTWVVWGVPLGLSGRWVTPFYLWYGLDQAHAAPPGVPGWASVPIGLGAAVIGLALAAPLLTLRGRIDHLLLSPTRAATLASREAELTTRVERLTATRDDAADLQSSELRRIERDLHDGAQARLVAVGLTLSTVAALIETDPPRARAMLAQAQGTSATALAELRALVRGIHPPVLSDRGLGDAVRAVALDTPIPVAVQVDLDGRLAAPVESAAYFATCELLANAARLANQVTVTITHRDSLLRVVVTDDGPGGADPTAGTGLRGLERRLATFDGTISLHSPAGGPTTITLEIPCASSSPRTSTS